MTLLNSTQKLQPGDPAPSFKLKNVDGSTVSLNDFPEKTLVIIFICNHCPYVHPKMEEIASLQREFEDQSVVVICINSNDSTDYPEDDFPHMQQIATKYGYNYYLHDESQTTAKDYGAVCTPDPFLFDKDHKLLFHGRINDAMNPTATPKQHDLRDALDIYLSGEPIEEWFIPSQGCSIKWK